MRFAAEPALRQVLAAPTVLEAGASMGIVPVQGAYGLGMSIPRPAVPAALAQALESSGELELASELSVEAFPSPNRRGYHLLHVGLEGREVSAVERARGGLQDGPLAAQTASSLRTSMARRALSAPRPRKTTVAPSRASLLEAVRPR